MTEKIKRLTPEQEARMPEFIERWTRIGLSTEPADRSRAEAAICEIYAQAGLAAPKAIVWCGSPLSLIHGRDKRLMRKRGECVSKILGSGLRRESGREIRDKVSTSVTDIVRANLWTNVHRELQSVSSGVLTGVMERLLESADDAADVNGLKTDLDGFMVAVPGQHSSHHYASDSYYCEVLGVRSRTARLSILRDFAQRAGPAQPHENICWVSERHNVLHRDDHCRLHSLTGPACAYPDGLAIYAIHGVRVPAFVVERPQEITVEKIDREDNAEVRRAMTDRYRHGEQMSGPAAFIRDAGGRRLDYDEKFGTLWRRELPDDEPVVLLEVVNATPEKDGTRKRYWLRVPPNMTTAREAAAWTFGLDGNEYVPEIET
jgi:hypothetical protein